MSLPIGSIVNWIVGMPGPDIDQAMVIGHNEGRYTIRFQCYGRGPWHEASEREDRVWLVKDPDFGKLVFGRGGIQTILDPVANLRAERDRLKITKPEGSL